MLKEISVAKFYGTSGFRDLGAQGLAGCVLIGSEPCLSFVGN